MCDKPNVCGRIFRTWPRQGGANRRVGPLMDFRMMADDDPSSPESPHPLRVAGPPPHGPCGVGNGDGGYAAGGG